MFRSQLFLGMATNVAFLLLTSALSAQLVWVQRGPGPITGGQTEGMQDREVVGAVHAVTPHPTNADVVYIGTTNAGVWRTTNARAPQPHWENLTAAESALSIGALEFDPTHVQRQTLVAGIGQFSSLARLGSPRIGLLRTTNGGTTWARLDGGGALTGLNISGVAPRGDTLVISVDDVDRNRPSSDAGIWRSEDGGANWTGISGANGTGLPAGPSFDLVGDRCDPAVLYTNAGRSGLFRSADAGATWTQLSDPGLDAAMASALNCEIAVGRASNIFVAIVQRQNHPSLDPRRDGGRLAAVFFSNDDGATWTDLGVPTTVEIGNKRFGAHPGGQGALHLSISADREDANIVYVGGDRQPHGNEGISRSQIWPNSIGAHTFSARSFRADASVQMDRWVHLTHSQSPSGGGTANTSAPHADSRDMDFDVNGELLEGCDGGIYRRTNPRENTGDWISMNGDLRATELHAVSWDAVSNIAVGGAQDNGAPESRRMGQRWNTISGGDGGVTLVDDFSLPGKSIRYSSAQFLQGMIRRTFDANNQLTTPPPSRVGLIVVDQNGQPVLTNRRPTLIRAQFYTPLALNRTDGDRILFGGSDAIYESLNQGDTARRLAPAGGGRVRVNDDLGHDCLSYGAANNADALYAGAEDRVFVRTAAPPAQMQRSNAYTGGTIQSLVMDPDDFEIAFVADRDHVFRTDDAGTSWDDVTNNLTGLDLGELHTLAYRPADDGMNARIIIGTQRGVASATAPNFDNWSQLGTGLPRAAIYHLEYDSTDNLLLAGILGRGAWTLEF